MKSLVTYDPFAETGFDDWFRGFFAPVRMEAGRTPMMVKMDVTETDDGYMIHAEMPGVKKEDIHVLIEGNTVSIDAKVEHKKELKEGETMLCTELYEGTVARTFTLLSDVDDTKAEARYENGMLELRLPKKAGAKSKALPVS